MRFGGIVALDDVSIDANRGEVLGIIGPNGAGKTTLFDVISGVRAPTRDRCCSTARTSPDVERSSGPGAACGARSSGCRRSAG